MTTWGFYQLFISDFASCEPSKYFSKEIQFLNYFMYNVVKIKRFWRKLYILHIHLLSVVLSMQFTIVGRQNSSIYCKRCSEINLDLKIKLKNTQTLVHNHESVILMTHLYLLYCLFFVGWGVRYVLTHISYFTNS